MKTPMIELLSYMELEMNKDKRNAREKENERYLAFLSAFYASPYADQKAREEFRKSVMPSNLKKREEPKLEWNMDLMKQLKDRQKGG